MTINSLGNPRSSWTTMRNHYQSSVALVSEIKSIKDNLADPNLSASETLKVLNQVQNLSSMYTDIVDSNEPLQTVLSTFATAATTAISGIYTAYSSNFQLYTTNTPSSWSPPFNNSIQLRDSKGNIYSAANNNLEDDVSPFSVAFYPRSSYTGPNSISAPFLNADDQARIMTALNNNAAVSFTLSTGATVRIQPGTVSVSGPRTDISPGSVIFSGSPSNFITRAFFSDSLTPVISEANSILNGY